MRRHADAGYLDNTYVQALKASLASSISFVFSIAVFRSFETPFLPPEDSFPCPRPLGVHALIFRSGIMIRPTSSLSTNSGLLPGQTRVQLDSYY